MTSFIEFSVFSPQDESHSITNKDDSECMSIQKMCDEQNKLTLYKWLVGDDCNQNERKYLNCVTSQNECNKKVQFCFEPPHDLSYHRVPRDDVYYYELHQHTEKIQTEEPSQLFRDNGDFLASVSVISKNDTPYLSEKSKYNFVSDLRDTEVSIYQMMCPGEKNALKGNVSDNRSWCLNLMYYSKESVSYVDWDLSPIILQVGPPQLLHEHEILVCMGKSLYQRFNQQNKMLYDYSTNVLNSYCTVQNANNMCVTPNDPGFLHNARGDRTREFLKFHVTSPRLEGESDKFYHMDGRVKYNPLNQQYKCPMYSVNPLSFPVMPKNGECKWFCNTKRLFKKRLSPQHALFKSMVFMLARVDGKSCVSTEGDDLELCDNHTEDRSYFLIMGGWIQNSLKTAHFIANHAVLVCTERVCDHVTMFEYPFISWDMFITKNYGIHYGDNPNTFLYKVMERNNKIVKVHNNLVITPNLGAIYKMDLHGLLKLIKSSTDTDRLCNIVNLNYRTRMYECEPYPPACMIRNTYYSPSVKRRRVDATNDNDDIDKFNACETFSSSTLQRISGFFCGEISKFESTFFFPPPNPSQLSNNSVLFESDKCISPVSSVLTDISNSDDSINIIESIMSYVKYTIPNRPDLNYKSLGRLNLNKQELDTGSTQYMSESPWLTDTETKTRVEQCRLINHFYNYYS